MVKKETKPAKKEIIAKKMGRPSLYNETIVESICTLLKNGKSLNKICKIEGFPAIETIWDWLEKYPDFLRKYIRAREAQADYLAEEIIDIAAETDVKAVYHGEEITLELSAAAVARNRLRVDAQKWYASKVNPKKYSDKTVLSNDPDSPITDPNFNAKLWIQETIKRKTDVIIKT
jgi:frataxin-like iron-binding protein CyaY